MQSLVAPLYSARGFLALSPNRLLYLVDFLIRCISRIVHVLKVQAAMGDLLIGLVIDEVIDEVVDEVI